MMYISSVEMNQTNLLMANIIINEPKRPHSLSCIQTHKKPLSQGGHISEGFSFDTEVESNCRSENFHSSQASYLSTNYKSRTIHTFPSLSPPGYTRNPTLS
jgi:hypothetical protein